MKNKKRQKARKFVNFINKIINYKYFVICVLFLSLILIIFTNQVTLRDFPNSGDEYSYLISAELFSVQKLSVPPPEHKEFFDFYHIINNGKFYGKYSPGWPFFLMFGVLIGLPWIMNLVFAVLTLVFVYLTAKEITSKKIAKVSLLLMATSPFFIFISSSYFSHSSNLFFLSVFIFIYFKNLKIDKKLNFFMMGILLGIAFNIRQLESIAIFIPFLIHYLYYKIKKKELKKELNNFFIFSLGFLIFFGVFLAYNYLQTGNPFLMPFNEYNPNDKPFTFDNGYAKSFLWAVNNLFRRVLILNIWIPFCFLFIFLGFIYSKKKDYAPLLLSLILSVILVYFFYARSGGNQYGPRYLYSSLPAIFILIAIGFEKLIKKRDYILPLMFIVSSLILFLYFSSFFHNQIDERMEVYDKVKEANITNAIVFLNATSSEYASGTMPVQDLTRNGIYFNNSALYVRNLNEKNSLLINDSPKREYYIWNCEKISINYIKILEFQKSSSINCSLTKLNIKNEKEGQIS